MSIKENREKIITSLILLNFKYSNKERYNEFSTLLTNKNIRMHITRTEVHIWSKYSYTEKEKISLNNCSLPVIIEYIEKYERK